MQSGSVQGGFATKTSTSFRTASTSVAREQNHCRFDARCLSKNLTMTS